jgi:hypothetical protein
VIVLGCDAPVGTVRSHLPPNCQVIPGMEVEGVMTVIPTLKFPFNISLEVSCSSSPARPAKRRIHSRGCLV